MFRKFFAVPAAMAAIAFLFAAPAAPKGDEGPEKDSGKSQSESGVYLAVSMPRRLPAGASVPVTVILKNDGQDDANLTVLWAHGLPFVALAVEDKNGKPTPLTLRGKKYLHPTDPGDIRRAGTGSIRRTKVKPGEIAELSVRNLAIYYDLTLAGDYVVTVEHGLTIGSGDKAREVRLKAKLKFSIENP